MLYQLGGVQFEVRPFNTHETSGDGEASFAEKPVMGRRPPLEFVGEGPQTKTLQCRIFPKEWGGLSQLSLLHAQRRAGKAQPLMRGDGTPEGWFVIDRINERASYLDADGVGKVIEVDVSLRRSDPPGAGSLFSIISGLI